jgi:hypothetical protein
MCFEDETDLLPLLGFESRTVQIIEQLLYRLCNPDNINALNDCEVFDEELYFLWCQNKHTGLIDSMTEGLQYAQF